MWLSSTDAERLRQVARWTGQTRPRAIISLLESGWRSALRDAADQGHGDAQLALANAIRDENAPEAKIWFAKAAKESIVARHNLAVIDWVQGKHESAARGLDECAKNGLPVAQYNLGLLYVVSVGARHSFELANKWLTTAQQNGFQQAALLQGLLLYMGRGVDRDYEAGVRQIRVARGGSLSDEELFVVRVLATDPHDHLRDGSSALVAARRLVARRASIVNLSALATAQAETSLFDDAVYTQWRVVRLLNTMRAAKDEDKKSARNRLALYMAEKKYRADRSAFDIHWADADDRPTRVAPAD